MKIQKKEIQEKSKKKFKKKKKKKKKIPFDYYKEIIANYRSQADKLDIHKIQEYISFYSNKDSLLDTIQKEIF